MNGVAIKFSPVALGKPIHQSYSGEDNALSMMRQGGQLDNDASMTSQLPMNVLGFVLRTTKPHAPQDCAAHARQLE
jgi:hypothetical protein